MEKLTSADYMLLLLDLDNQKPISGSVRLMKMMFLFEKEISPLLKNKGMDISQMPEFIAYDYGPFAKDIYEQIDLFSNIGFISTKKIDVIDQTDEFDDWNDLYGEDVFDVNFKNGYRFLNIDYKSVEYKIENIGHQFVKDKIYPNITAEIIDIMTKFKNKIISIGTRQLLYYVYSRYGEYTTKSKIKNKILGENNTMPADDDLIIPNESDSNV